MNDNNIKFFFYFQLFRVANEEKRRKGTKLIFLLFSLAVEIFEEQVFIYTKYEGRKSLGNSHFYSN